MSKGVVAVAAAHHLLELFEGVGTMLDSLSQRGVKIAVWTGRDRQTTEELVRLLRLENRFATLLCGDDLPTHKPDPAGLREIMRRLGVTPSETLFVGDADVDVLGGHACGVDTILIRHAREIAEEVIAKSWHAVLTPAEAFAVVVRCVSH